MNLKAFQRILILIVLLVGLVLTSGCTSPIMDQAMVEKSPTDDKASGAFQIDSIRARIYEGGKMTTLMQAKKGRIDFREKQTVMREVEVNVIQADGTKALLESQQGTLYMTERPDENIARNDVLLEGGVKITFGDFQFEMPGVHYNSANLDETFVSSGNHFNLRFKTESGPLACSGKTMRANRALTKFIMIGPGTAQNLSEDKTK